MLAFPLLVPLTIINALCVSVPISLLSTALTEAMRLTSTSLYTASGINVGFGTTSPNAKLEVYVTRTSSTNATAIILNDNVTGAQTNGVYKSIQSLSNAGASKSEIRFLESDGTNNNTSIAFATASTAGGITERMRVLNTGNVLCLAGGNTTATGTGIAFPSSQNTSSDPNTLDDYEEGTWTATLTASVTPPTIPVTVTGAYTKIGRQVTVTCSFLNRSMAGSVGNVQISGLPFVVGADDCHGICGNNSLSSASLMVTAFAGTSILSIRSQDTTVYTPTVAGSIYVLTTVTYFV